MAELIRIKLNYNYVIDVESMCYTLKYLYTGKTKDGKTKKAERACGYYGRIDYALEKYIYLAHIDRSPDKVMELKEYAEMVEKAAKNALRGLQKELERFPVK